MTVTRELVERLGRHYIRPGERYPGGVLLTEVEHGRHRRRCDAIYVGFTAASGKLLVGHEIKATRGDWLRELDTPTKSVWAEECHAWYVVAPSTAVVRVGELPPGWGLLTANGGRSRVRMHVAAQARVHLEHQPSWAACRSILQSFDTQRAGMVEQARQAERAEVASKVEALAEHRLRLASPAYAEARDKLAAVEQALGCELTAWGWDNDLSYEELRAAAAIVRAARPAARVAHDLARGYHNPATRLRAMADQLDQTAHALNTLHTAQGEEVGRC